MKNDIPDSLHLSRLLLNPRSRRVANELFHPYEMHRTLAKAFPEEAFTAKDGEEKATVFLFRAEEEDNARPFVTVYVQSVLEPDWTKIPNRDDYLHDSPESASVSCKDIMPAYQTLRDGQVLSFRLRANPTKRIGKTNADLPGKRVALLREEEQVEWLARKGRGDGTEGTGGFELVMNEGAPSVTVVPEGKKFGRKTENGQKREMTHNAVLFDGLLQITDADAFRGTLLRGIGSAKAFGFGLLSIAKRP